MRGPQFTTYRANRRAAWVADYLDRRAVLAGGAKVDPMQFVREDGTQVQLTAARAVGTTSMAVTALANPIPAGTVLAFSPSGSWVTVSTAAAAGATAVLTSPLQYALANGEEAWYAGTGQVYIPSGTVLGRTIAERDAGTPYGPAIDTDEEIYLLVHDIDDAQVNDDADLYRHGSLVKVNFLPGWATMDADLAALVAAAYQTTIGAD
jgi:hypothetical protein